MQSAAKNRVRTISFLRSIALFTLVAFIATQTFLPAPSVFAKNSNVSGGDPVSALTGKVLDGKTVVPPELGLIEESFHGTSGKTILYLQDAHDSLEAQENIAKIINHLVANDGVKTVFEEGYEGPVPTDKYFGFIKDPKVKEKVAYFLMDHLRVGGAEYAHINRTKDFNLVGADSLKLHKENVDQYRLSAAKKDSITKDLKTLEKELKSLTDSRFPKELKGWLKTKEQFDAKKLDLFMYLGRTMPLLGKHGAEKGAGLIGFILDAIHSSDPAVIEKAKHIDAREVFSELIKIEQAVSETYLHDTSDKQLFEYYKILSLLNRLNELQVSQEEYEAVKTSLKAFDTDSFARFIFSQAPKTLILSRMWEQNIKDAIRFYEIAAARDDAISSAFGNHFRGKHSEVATRDIAVLVYGGFHKENIKRILEAKGISYLVVTPRITKPSPRHEEFYKQLMTKGMYKFEVPLNLRFASRALPVFAFANGGDEVRAIDNVIERGVEPDMVERYLFNTSQGIQSVRSEVRNNTQRIIFPGTADVQSQEEIGEKPFKLLKMYKAGFNIPPFFVVASNHTGKMVLDDELRSAFDSLPKPIIARSAHKEEGRKHSFSGVFQSFPNIHKLDEPDEDLTGLSEDERERRQWEIEDQEPTNLRVAYERMVGLAANGILAQKYVEENKIADFNPNEMNMVVMEQLDLDVFAMFVTADQRDPNKVNIHYEIRNPNLAGDAFSKYGIITYDKQTHLLADSKLNPTVQNIVKEFGDIAGRVEGLFGVQQIELGAAKGKVYVLQSRNINLTNPKDVPRFPDYQTISKDLVALGYGYYKLPVIVVDDLEHTDHAYYQDVEFKKLWDKYTQTPEKEAEARAAAYQATEEFAARRKDAYKQELLGLARQYGDYILVIKDASAVLEGGMWGKNYDFLNQLASGAKATIRGRNQNAIRHEDWLKVEKGDLTIIPPETGHVMERFGHRFNQRWYSREDSIITGDALNVLSNTDGVFVWKEEPARSEMRGKDAANDQAISNRAYQYFRKNDVSQHRSWQRHSLFYVFLQGLYDPEPWLRLRTVDTLSDADPEKFKLITKDIMRQIRVLLNDEIIETQEFALKIVGKIAKGNPDLIDADLLEQLIKLLLNKERGRLHRSSADTIAAIATNKPELIHQADLINRLKDLLGDQSEERRVLHGAFVGLEKLADVMPEIMTTDLSSRLKRAVVDLVSREKMERVYKDHMESFIVEMMILIKKIEPEESFSGVVDTLKTLSTSDNDNIKRGANRTKDDIVEKLPGLIIEPAAEAKEKKDPLEGKLKFIQNPETIYALAVQEKREALWGIENVIQKRPELISEEVFNKLLVLFDDSEVQHAVLDVIEAVAWKRPELITESVMQKAEASLEGKSSRTALRIMGRMAEARPVSMSENILTKAIALIGDKDFNIGYEAAGVVGDIVKQRADLLKGKAIDELKRTITTAKGRERTCVMKLIEELTDKHADLLEELFLDQFSSWASNDEAQGSKVVGVAGLGAIAIKLNLDDGLLHDMEGFIGDPVEGFGASAGSLMQGMSLLFAFGREKSSERLDAFSRLLRKAGTEENRTAVVRLAFQCLRLNVLDGFFDVLQAQSGSGYETTFKALRLRFISEERKSNARQLLLMLRQFYNHPKDVTTLKKQLIADLENILSNGKDIDPARLWAIVSRVDRIQRNIHVGYFLNLYDQILVVRKIKNSLREDLQIPTWEVFSPGNMIGRMHYIDNEDKIDEVKEGEILVMERFPDSEVQTKRFGGIIALEEASDLSHPMILARHEGVPMLVCLDREMIEGYFEKNVKVTVVDNEVQIEETQEAAKIGGAIKVGPPVILPKVHLTGDTIILPKAYRPEEVGNKAFNLRELDGLELADGERQAKHLGLSFGLYQQILNYGGNASISEQIAGFVQALGNVSLSEADARGILTQLRQAIESLEIPEAVLTEIGDAIKQNVGNVPVFLRSSSNAEDLPGYVAAGLYESIGAVDPGDRQQLAGAIKKVWASVWNERAFFNRNKSGISHQSVHMAILVHEMIPSEYSFVMHTMNPLNNNPDEMMIEIVEGLGEALVGGSKEFEGVPHRFLFNRRTGEVRQVRYADKDYRLVVRDGAIHKELVSYSDDVFALPGETKTTILKRLFSKGIKTQEFFKNAQDIEGALVKKADGSYEVVFVQTRDQVNMQGNATSKEQMRERLSRLETIKNKDISGITDEDKQYLVEVARHFDIYPEYLEKKTDKKELQLEAVVLFTLTSAELNSLDLPDAPIFTLSAIDEIGDGFFAHELGHLFDDIFNLGSMFRADDRWQSSQHPDIQKELDRVREIFGGKYRDENIGWRRILDGWAGIRSLNPKVVLALINGLESYIKEVVQQRASIVRYLHEHRSEIGDDILNKFLESAKKSDAECDHNLWQLGRIKRNIQQSRESTMIDINKSVQDASAPYKEADRFDLQLQLSSDMPNIPGSSVKVAYIWTNLFRNGIDAIREALDRDKTKKGKLSVKTQTVTKDDRRYIEVSVSDNGAGIPAELLQGGRLFQKGVTTKRYGNGLGLYLIKQTVDELGGTIDIQSVVGKGTTISVRLPSGRSEMRAEATLNLDEGKSATVELSQANIPTPMTPEIRPMGRISLVPTVKPWQILHLKQDVIVVIEQARIDALSPEMFKELLEIAGLNNGKLHLVVSDALQGKYSQRVAELRKVASVYYGFPQLAASDKIPVIGFSDMERDTLPAFQKRLDPRLAGRVKDSAFGLNQAGSFGVGILYALGDVSRSELRQKNGYFYDAVGRWSTQVLEVLKAYTVISTSA